MKVFTFGSCRIRFPTSKHQIYSNIDLCHSTKEVIQYLDIMDKKKNVLEAVLPQGIIYASYLDRTCLQQGDIYLQTFKRDLDQCDIVYLEISCIKEIVDEKGFYYQLNRLTSCTTTHVDLSTSLLASYTLQTKESILADLRIIQERLHKPIIVQSHWNLDFLGQETLKDSQYRIPNRQLIDEAVWESGFPSIIPRHLFSHLSWKDVVPDMNHMTDMARDELQIHVDDIIDKIATTIT